MAEQEVQNGGAEKAVAVVEFTAVTPQLLVEAPKANDAVLFYKSAFGAEEVSRSMHPKRKADQETPLILSAELKLAGFSILVSDLADDSSTPYVFSPFSLAWLLVSCVWILLCIYSYIPLDLHANEVYEASCVCSDCFLYLFCFGEILFTVLSL